MEIALLITIIIFCLINMTLLFFLGLYAVRMNERFSNMVSDLAQIILSNDSTAPIVNNETETKTWDQKYEEELEAFTRRLRADSGLVDPNIGNNYNAPPAPNLRNSEGLTVKNR